ICWSRRLRLLSSSALLASPSRISSSSRVTSARSSGSALGSGSCLRIKNSRVTAPKPQAMMSRNDRLKGVAPRLRLAISAVWGDLDQAQFVAGDADQVAGAEVVPVALHDDVVALVHQPRGGAVGGDAQGGVGVAAKARPAGVDLDAEPAADGPGAMLVEDVGGRPRAGLALRGGGRPRARHPRQVGDEVDALGAGH